MSRTITGPIETPTGVAITGATIRFVAISNNASADGSTPLGVDAEVVTDGSGTFSVALNNGSYRVLLQEQDTDTWLTMGSIVVETDTSTTIGALIAASDTSSVLTFLDVATQTWVAAYVLGGASPADIPVTSLDVGTATAGQYLRINGGGTAIIGEDPPRELEYFYGQIG